MPTYEYECKRCGHRFEAFQSMKDAPLTECPECGGELRRLLGTGAGFLFKGSGFYTTDYRSSSYREKAKQEGGKPGESKDASGETKKEPKKEPKKESPGGAGGEA